VAHAAVTGRTDQAIERHEEMQGFVDSLRWPSANYIRRRHRLLRDVIPALSGDEDRTMEDRVLIDGKPMQIGRAWAYYGRLIPCCELAFWSES
jgi:hypothetical protein